MYLLGGHKLNIVRLFEKWEVTGILLLNADAVADADADADNADDGRRGYGNGSPYFQYGELKMTIFELTYVGWI